MGGASLNVGSQAIGDSENIDYLNKIKMNDIVLGEELSYTILLGNIYQITYIMD